MMLISIAAMVAAIIVRKRLVPRYGGWAASLIGGAGYLAVVIVAGAFLLPAINEVPEAFPAVLLWRFRMASLGMQAIMWTTIGLLFGWLTERAMPASRSYRLRGWRPRNHRL
jgi:predicted cobalt transporter CbtA